MHVSANTAANRYITSAETALAMGKPEEALRHLEGLSTEKLDAATTAHVEFLTGRTKLELKLFSEAARHLQAAVHAQKGNASYRMAYGSALHFSGQLDLAAQQYREASRLAPTAENPPFNLGTVLAQLGDLSGAERAYRTALTKSPRFVDAMAALADLLAMRGDLAEAASMASDARTLDPRNANAACVLGTIHERAKNLESAHDQYASAVDLDPAFAEAWSHLGRMQSALGKRELAWETFGRAIALDPSNEKYPYLRSMYADPKGVTDDAATPWRRVPDTVVKELFDQYAETFDVALVSKLSYQTPEHLASLLDECSGVGRGFRSTLDLGCGTGLMAQHLRARSRILIGIDLSQGMLRKAQARGYDELVESEIVHYLVRCQASDVDLIAAADVFNYFGDLGPLFETISRVIAGGGVLLFSVESLEAVDPRSVAKYQAQPTGRFVHRVDHVSDLLRSHGFTEITSRNVVLRREENCDVIGCAFHCVKPID